MTERVSAILRRHKNTVYWAKFFLYVTSFVWVMYGAVFFHELGHAIAVLSLGGTLHEFVVAWDFSGYVIWSVENVPSESLQQTITLFCVSGGIGAALFFMVLSHKSKWFMIPALFALIDGFGEALYHADARYSATCGVTISTFFVCIWLLWQFDVRHRNKKVERIEWTLEHACEEAIRALSSDIDRKNEK